MEIMNRVLSRLTVGKVQMKKLLGCLAVASLIGGPAVAADMALKAAPAPAPVTSWTGCYGGINGGGVGATDKEKWSNVTEAPTGFAVGAATVLPAAANLRNSEGDFIVGAQLGCNYQTGAWVWGAVGDINYTGISNTTQVTSQGLATIVPGNIAETFSSRWLSTVRGRLGFTLGGPVLYYGTGGLAVANVSYSDQLCFPTAAVPGCGTVSSSSTRVGYAAGGGIEFQIAPRWTVNAEYLYVNLGTTTNTLRFLPAVFPLANLTTSHTFVENIGRVGINYRF
jgi:outer membrane immunogenic protein